MAYHPTLRINATHPGLSDMTFRFRVNVPMENDAHKPIGEIHLWMDMMDRTIWRQWGGRVTNKTENSYRVGFQNVDDMLLFFAHAAAKCKV